MQLQVHSGMVNNLTKSSQTGDTQLGWVAGIRKDAPSTTILLSTIAIDAVKGQPLDPAHLREQLKGNV